jgi:hypothetical protein
MRLRRAIIAGFVATVAMTFTLAIAYLVALQLGSPDFPSYVGTPGPQQWMWALTHNPVTELAREAPPAALAFHLALGVLWAVLYAAWFEPRLPGDDWQRGIVFALIPFVLSVVAFLPLVGGGLFGLALGAGPLPVIGNLILHLVYGATLGAVYGRAGDRVLSETGLADAEESAVLERAERRMADGIVIGGVLGVVLGVAGTGLLHGLPGPVSPAAAGFFWLLLGGALGALIGSMFGLGGRGERPAPRRTVRDGDKRHFGRRAA